MLCLYVVHIGAFVVMKFSLVLYNCICVYMCLVLVVFLFCISFNVTNLASWLQYFNKLTLLLSLVSYIRCSTDAGKIQQRWYRASVYRNPSFKHFAYFLVEQVNTKRQ